MHKVQIVANDIIKNEAPTNPIFFMFLLILISVISITFRANSIENTARTIKFLAVKLAPIEQLKLWFAGRFFITKKPAANVTKKIVKIFSQFKFLKIKLRIMNNYCCANLESITDLKVSYGCAPTITSPFIIIVGVPVTPALSPAKKSAAISV